jgi:hypothetical protein
LSSVRRAGARSTGEESAAVLAAIPERNFMLNGDPRNAAAGAGLYDVHMKELTDFQKKDRQVAVGDGMMPVRGYLKCWPRKNIRDLWI